MLHELFRTFLSWSLILPTAFLMGSCYDRWIPSKGLFSRGVLYYALGFATLSYSIILLSAFHLLTIPVLWGLLILCFLARIRRVKDWFRWLRDVAEGFSGESNVLFRILLGAFMFLIFILLLGTLTPELGGDALCYQLNLPKVFLKAGSIAPDPLDYNSYFPLFMNNLYLVGLATGGVFSAKLFNFVFGVLLVCCVYRELLRETGNKPFSLFLCMVVLVTPAFYNMISTTYVDVGLSFYVLLMFVSFREGLMENDPKICMLSGFLAGCAVSIKYLACAAVVGLFPVWIYAVLTEKKIRTRLFGLLCFFAGFFALAGYWLIRNGIVTGNPVFPYLGNFFKGVSPLQMVPPQFGVGRSFFDFLLLYWNMFLRPDTFGAFTTRIGIFYPILTVFLWVSLIVVPRARVYALFVFAFTIQLFFLAQVDRYVMPVLPVMAVGGGVGMYWVFQKYFSKNLVVPRIVMGLGFALLFYYAAAGVFHYRYAYFLDMNKWSLQTYQRSLERTGAVADWVDKNLPQDVKILFEEENRLFYFNRPVLRQCFLAWHLGRPDVLVDREGRSLTPLEVQKLLRDHGVTHILASNRASREWPEAKTDSVSQRLLGAALVREVYQGQSENIREERVFYRLYAMM
ncbi:MAG TPA: phospholipid carrier-dependent glycosyltransferase [Candidatus Omnitrophota bacterium]|nr:phospholipid carrier-dependent glycosyltransferase [Candidatus Omnitrophota bacterium]